MTNNPVKLKSIQVMRGLAALIVVLFHSNETILQYHWESSYLLTKWGALGVDIFFVISGFVMIATTQNRGIGFTVGKAFMRDRLIRIVPLYWILTTMMVMLLLFIPSAFNQMKFDLMRALTSYFFIPSSNTQGGEVSPIIIVGWTLVYEMWFYLIFAFLMCFTRRHILLFVAMFFGWLSLLSLLKSGNLYFKTYSNPIMLEFVFGCCIGTLYFQRIGLSKQVSVGLLVVGLLLLSLFSFYKIDLVTPRFIYWGIPSALVITGVIFLERGNNWPSLPLLERVGDSSYSLYLTHTFTLPVIGKLMQMIDPSHLLYGNLLLPIMVLGSIAIGFAVHRLIEKPIDRFLRRLFKIDKHHRISISK